MDTVSPMIRQSDDNIFRVLVISPKCISFPIGLAYISAAIKKAGFEVDCVNLSHQHDYKIPYKYYDVVATGGLACHFNEIEKIVLEAKTAGSRVIVGGGLITAEPDFIVQHIPADWFVTGEGDQAIMDLLPQIRDGKVIERITIGSQIEDLDSLPFPDYESFGLQEYLDRFRASEAFFTDMFDNPRLYPIVASRSCPFRCTFCYSPLGNKYRQRSVDSIIAELKEAIPKYKINIVQIVDELFSYSEQRVSEFCDKFNRLRKSFDWEIRWGGSLRVDKLNPDMFDTLRDSGFTWVQYGFESYSPNVLNSMKKKITPEQIHNAVHLTLEKGISVQGNFIFGDRAETLETANETLEFWKDHPEAGIPLFFIWAVPNSELYQYCLDSGIIKDKLDYYRRGVFEVRNMTELSNEEFEQLRGKVTIYNIKYTSKAIPDYVSDTKFSVTCPHCITRITYDNFTVYEGCTFPTLFPLKPGKLFFFRSMYCRHCRKSFMATSRLAAWWLRIIILTYTPRFLGVYKFIINSRRVIRGLPGVFASK